MALTALTAQPSDSRDSKLAAYTARRIEDDIIAAGWPVGEVIGSEQELRERYGVSRAVLREAVRLVEHHSVAVMRRGPNGGLIVQQPNAQPATIAMAIYLEYAGATVNDLMHARLVLEPMAASLAAEHITEAGLAELREVLELEASYNATQQASPATDLLHRKIAELCGNAPLSAFIGVLLTLTARYAAQPSRAVGGARVVAEEVTQAHDSVVEAIIAGNGSLAEHRTARHIEAVGAWMRDHRAGPPRGLTETSHIEGDSPAKLAEIVAARIYDDILGGGGQTGDVIGSEAELLLRYGVSRAVLREAVRLLEHHSVARMRRGPGGGLVLAEPDPRASTDAMAVFLEYGGVDAEELRVTRNAVELACVDLVTARATDPDVRKALDEANVIEASMDRAMLVPVANDLHSTICELAGNPVLALFANVLRALWERHTLPHTAMPEVDVAAAVHTAHSAIVEAILHGEAALARRRMRRHLDALTDWWQ
ncbi:MAG: FadR/GntR family transcriptional regulator [Mycobacteriales bacterium]